MYPMRALACALLATAVLQQATLTAAQKLTGNSTGSGFSCTPDPYQYGLGQGCSKGEACCPQTSTCVKATSCSEFKQICPPPSCGKDVNFVDGECPAEATKTFKSPRGLKCSSSADAVCFTNGTAMVVTCTNAAGSAAVTWMVLLLSLLASLTVTRWSL